jgi:ribonuclease-3
MKAGGLERLLGEGLAGDPLIEEALTHRSAGRRHNERLEFLGDAVLELVVSELLYRRFPQADDGDLSRLRSHLVRRETLAELARELELGERVRLGPGERKSGGHRRDTILADALEALIGAVYLHGGFDGARRFILRLWEPRLRDLPAAGALKDPKTRLQELLQARHLPLPEYELLEVRGAEHARSFHVACRVPGGGQEADAWGSSRKRAEQACAAALLDRIGGPIPADHE